MMHAKHTEKGVCQKRQTPFSFMYYYERIVFFASPSQESHSYSAHKKTKNTAV